MDFDGAIKAHSAWKQKLSNYIARPNGSLDAGTVGRDDRCALGQWLYGEGKQHASPVYDDLLAAHARFHTCAGDMIRRIDGGQVVTERDLGDGSDFGDRSLECITLIVAMKREASGIKADGLTRSSLRRHLGIVGGLLAVAIVVALAGLFGSGTSTTAKEEFLATAAMVVGAFVALVFVWRKLDRDLSRKEELEHQSEANAVRAASEASDMAAKVESLLSTIRSAAEGNLTTAVEVVGADSLGRLGLGIEKLISDVRSNIGQIARSSETLAAAAEELEAVSSQMGSATGQSSDQARVVSHAAQGVATDVESASTAAEELSASIAEIARSASSATDVAGHAVLTARGASESVERLRVSSAEIGEIIQVITSIAEQTNLLALNATIEAARAGEAGKGFAVVANEVKELANATARATDDIATKVDAMRQATNESIQAIGQIVTTIDRIAELQSTIASAVEEQAAVTNEIASSMVNAGTGMGSISDGIGEVAAATGAAASGAHDTAQASEDLSRMAGHLRQLVDAFTY